MPWGAAIAAVGAIGGAYIQNKGAQDAADSQSAAQQAAIDEQRRQYDQTRQDLSPYMQWGGQAIPLLSKLNAGDYSGFLNSPDYQAAFQQGQGAIDSSAASRGGLFGGGHTKDSIAFGSGLASQYLGNYRNALFQQAGSGQNAAAGLGGLGANMATNIGNAYTNMGNAQANGAYGSANAYSNALNSLGQIGGYYFGNKSQPQTMTGYGQSGMQYTAPSSNGGSWINGYGAG